MVIAIDFDGTIARHRYPDLGAPVPGAFEWMQRWQAAGAKLMLWTMRHDSEKEGPVLTDAVRFCRENGVEFWAVNENPQQDWSGSHKQYANVYVDDAAFGCPLVTPPSGRPYVDWSVVGPAVMQLLTKPGA